MHMWKIPTTKATCSHEIAACELKKQQVHPKCSINYQTSTLKFAYEASIFPLGNEGKWVISNIVRDVLVLPLKQEVEDNKKQTKVGRTIKKR